MMGFDRTDDYQPLTYIKGHPLYVTTLVICLHVAAFIVGCLLLACNQAAVLTSLAFSNSAVIEHLHLWQVFTYAFVHLPASGLFLAIELFMLFQFGYEVEKYFGRKIFIALYTALLLTPPLAFLIVGSLTKVELPLASSWVLHFGIFVAFVTLYPNVQFFFGILAKWIVYAFVGINTLIMLAYHDSSGLLALWSTLSVAYFGTRQAGGGGGEFSLMDSFREKFPKRATPVGVKPRAKPRRLVTENATGDVYESIDPLLDKISQHGIGSLTRSERATLERARVSLLRKERGV